MKVFRSFPHGDAIQPCALAIGNFDGVHRGHRVLLEQVKAAADRLGVVPAVLTFNPHPRQFFAKRAGMPAETPITITPFRDKMQAMADAGVERVYIARFDESVASLTAEEFIQKILRQSLNVRWMIVGENFLFGKGRSGTTDMLMDAGRQSGFEVVVQPSVMDQDVRVSSSEVRQALSQSDFDRVATLLGRSYTLSGHVVRGNQLGRQLGFPTANLPVRQDNPTLSGVFVTQVHGLDKQPLPAVSMVGNRPTVVENGRTVLETHVLDYTGNCYGSLIKVEFLKKLRDNQKFPGLDALKAAIRLDVDMARQYFRTRNAVADID